MVRRSPNSSAAGVQQVRKTAVAPVHFHYSCLFFLERNPKVVCRRVRVCRHSRPNRCCIAFSYHKWSTRSFYSTSIHGVHSSLGSTPPPTTFQCSLAYYLLRYVLRTVSTCRSVLLPLSTFTYIPKSIFSRCHRAHTRSTTSPSVSLSISYIAVVLKPH